MDKMIEKLNITYGTQEVFR